MASHSKVLNTEYFSKLPYEVRMDFVRKWSWYWSTHSIPFQLEKQDEPHPTRTVRNHVPFYGNR